MNEVDELLLEHFGTKGMRWGTRTSRQQNRELNKASRNKDRQKHLIAVEKARANVKSGKTKSEFLKAKSQHSANKIALGSREARKILNKARDKKYLEVNTAQTAKNGKEVAVRLAAAGLFAAALVTIRVAAK
jgi:hypothetical protein